MNKKAITLIVVILLVIIIAGIAIAVISNQDKDERNSTITVNEALAESEENQVNELNSQRILTVYFSMTGNTEKIANFIHNKVGGDIVKLETVQTYPTEYNELLAIAQEEKSDNARPELATELNLENYNVIFIGYPIWCYTMPMSIYTLLDEYDFSNKVIIPFTTHGTSGPSGTFEEIAKQEPNATVLEGFGAYDETVDEREKDVNSWLEGLGFTSNEISENNNMENNSEETKITVTIGDRQVEGVLNNTALAEEIREMFPLTVTMGRYGTREFYGGIDETPSNTGEGKLNFENGDITYCPTNNTLAIFYNQSDRPNLTMEVIKIGEITSDLSIFDEIDSRVEMVFDIAN